MRASRLRVLLVVMVMLLAALGITVRNSFGAASVQQTSHPIWSEH
jgi:hypothetical protein